VESIVKNFLSRKRFEEQNAGQETAVQFFTYFGKEHYMKEFLNL
jgi:hypothetical protein